jgi:Holliday junction DNA helicase RuvB
LYAKEYFGGGASSEAPSLMSGNVWGRQIRVLPDDPFDLDRPSEPPPAYAVPAPASARSETFTLQRGFGSPWAAYTAGAFLVLAVLAIVLAPHLDPDLAKTAFAVSLLAAAGAGALFISSWYSHIIVDYQLSPDQQRSYAALYDAFDEARPALWRTRALPSTAAEGRRIVSILDRIPATGSLWKMYALLPDGVLSVAGWRLAFVAWADIVVSIERFQETCSPREWPPEAFWYVSRRWQHERVGGGPDRRYSSNQAIDILNGKCILLGDTGAALSYWHGGLAEKLGHVIRGFVDSQRAELAAAGNRGVEAASGAAIGQNLASTARPITTAGASGGVSTEAVSGAQPSPARRGPIDPAQWLTKGMCAVCGTWVYRYREADAAEHCGGPLLHVQSRPAALNMAGLPNTGGTANASRANAGATSVETDGVTIAAQPDDKNGQRPAEPAAEINGAAATPNVVAEPTARHLHEESVNAESRPPTRVAGTESPGISVGGDTDDPSQGTRPLDERSAAIDESVTTPDGAPHPKTLAEYVGQEAVKASLRVAIDAAKGRGESLDHLLLYGPPGVGKASLAHIIAREMGVDIRSTAGPMIVRPGDLGAILTNLEAGDVLFIREIDRVNRAVEEVLCSAMQHYQIDVIVGQGASARAIKLDLKRFTLIGVTTRAGLLPPRLRSCFGASFRLDFYSPDELATMIRRSARILDIPIGDSGAMEIAKRARGTPRVAFRLLRRVRDYAQVRAQGVISAAIADEALTLFEVDRGGLDKIDRAILLALLDRFGGGPVRIEALAAAIGEEPEAVEYEYEPFLSRQGYINISPKGYTATPLAFSHLGRTGRGQAAHGKLFDG